MSTSQITPILQRREWPLGNNDENFLFIDLDLALKLKLKWTAEVITEATLTLFNFSSTFNYKICGVTKCPADGEYPHPYFSIHLGQNGTTYKSEFTATSNQLGSLSLPKGAEAHFLFRIHDSCPKTLLCGFDFEKPGNKNGSIIISI